MHEHDFIEHTQISLTSLNTLKINSRTNRGTSEGSETSADEYSTRRIQICRVNFYYHRKKDPADLNSPRQELSNSGLRIVAQLDCI